MLDHDKHLPLIRQLRELGATEVSLTGETLSVKFTEVTPVLHVPEAWDPTVALTPSEDDEEGERKAWEELQYFSSGG